MNRSGVIRFLSVWPTPLLVLGSAHELFLRNQKGLDGVLADLMPFWLVSIGAVACAWMLALVSSKPWGL